MNPVSLKLDILHVEVKAEQFIPVKNAISIDALVSEFESDKQMAAAIVDARKLNSSSYNFNGHPTFTSLRLTQGMSQDQLANRAATSQSYIAKLEAGRNDPSTDVIARLATALSLDEEVVFTAIRIQRKMREAQL